MNTTSYYSGSGEDEIKPPPQETSTGRDIFKLEFEIDRPNLLTFLTSYKVMEVLLYGLSPPVVVFGILCNIVVLLVCMQKEFRTNSFALGVISLAVIDICLLVNFTISTWLPNLLFWRESYEWFSQWQIAFEGTYLRCAFRSFFSHVLQLASPWTIVVISVERCIAIFFPLKAKLYLTKRHILGTLMFVYFAILLSGIWAFFLIDSVYTQGQALCQASDTRKARILYYINITSLATFCPFLIILISNISSMIKLRIKYNERKRLTGTTSKIGTSGKGNSIMLITVSLTFLGFTFVAAIFRILLDHSPQMFQGKTNVDTATKLTMYSYIGSFIYHTNSAINLLLYGVSGKKFRECAAKMMKGCRKSGAN